MNMSKTLALSFGTALLVLATQAQAADTFKAGIDFQTQASIDEIGLPLYPGAQPRKDSGDDKSAVSMGVWGGSFGVKLQAAKFSSSDSAEAVARFYRDALARYGKVLDCSAGAPREAEAGKDSDQLRCDDSKPAKGTLSFKAGKKKDFRAVSIEPGSGKGVEFQLVHFEGKGF
ncbi:hypothetical protein RQP53_08075 [Paucibacter sp. APW11]|uniref:Secreted protein n=1 Tax=Roseateles aquae TaxID=3077235 RepID=A0ABU3P9G8_9BURK|nr:hypothetical protein [Paucibacter sp. APW11]MDT8999222.1 hypothetical protein [Paucibacter sp. APW11]